MPKLSVIIPVYQNAGSLPALFGRLGALASRLKTDLGTDLELIFVDDGSTDESFTMLAEHRIANPGTKLIKLARNFGAVNASKTGMRFVSGDCFLCLAADLQDPPELIPDLVRRWLDGAKFIICQRRERSDPLLSRILAGLYYWLIRRFVLPDYPRRGYDLALLDEAMREHLVSSAKNVNTPLLAFWLGFRPEIVEYDRAPRLHGRSQWSFGKRIKFMLDSILGFSILPIRIMSTVGLAVSALSFAYGASVLVASLVGWNLVAGFPTLAVVTTFLLGLVITMLGIIGEYLWRVFDATNGRPEAVIEEALL